MFTFDVGFISLVDLRANEVYESLYSPELIMKSKYEKYSS